MPRVADLPCAACGELMWRGSTSLPDGLATCRPCRRADWAHGTRKGYREMKCRCAQCVEWNRSSGKDFRQRRREEGRPWRKMGHSCPWISPATRLAVFERDDWRCALCGDLTDPLADPQSDWYPSLDHIVPQSRGGGHGVENLRTAHRWCNSIRGADDHHSELFEAVP